MPGLFVCSLVDGDKVNLELRFGEADAWPPPLEELRTATMAAFAQYSSGGRVAYPIARMQTFDESLYRWVDLVTPQQLSDRTQVFAWPASVSAATPTKVGMDIPAPSPSANPNRPAFGSPNIPRFASTSPGAVPTPQQVLGSFDRYVTDGSPQADRDARSSSGGAAHQLRFMSPNGTGLGDRGISPSVGDEATLAAQLRSAQQKEDDLRKTLEIAVAERRRLEKAVEKARKVQEEQNRLAAEAPVDPVVEIASLRARLRVAEAELDDYRSGSPERKQPQPQQQPWEEETTPRPADNNGDASRHENSSKRRHHSRGGDDNKKRKERPGRPVVEDENEHCSLIGDFIRMITQDDRKVRKTSEDFDDCDKPLQPYKKQPPTARETVALPLRLRLQRFYRHYDPNRLNSIDEIMKAFKGREKQLFTELERRYGPESAAIGGAGGSPTAGPKSPIGKKAPPRRPGTKSLPAAKAPEPTSMDTRASLVAFFQKHNPEKVNDVDLILEAYGGRIPQLQADLKEKYGATFSTKRPAAPSSRPVANKPAAHVDPTAAPGGIAADDPNEASIYNDDQQLKLDDWATFNPSIVFDAVPDRAFKGPGPSLEGQMKPFFNGDLYRLVAGAMSDTWYFYNDTQKYEMHVTYKFGPDSRITPLGKTTMNRDREGWYVCELVVFPGQTDGFITGPYNGFHSSMEAQPLTESYLRNYRFSAEDTVRRETEAVTSLPQAQKRNVNEEELLEACLKAGIRYVDPNFGPTTKSLSRPSIDSRNIEPMAWKRPTQYLPSDLHQYITIHRKIEPNDIDQGMLGDCWFLCSVASLAEFPSKVRDIFEHPSSGDVSAREQALGAYRVTLNKHGWWYVVIVDDYLPVLGDKPCFAKNVEDQTELWPCLIEKAYAKLHGSYAAIAGGDALHALQDLSGYPVSRFDDDYWNDAVNNTKAARELFERLLNYDQSRYLITFSTPGHDTSAYMGAEGQANSSELEERYKRAGLGMGHAYSVLQVKNFAQYGLRLVQIRNPWGNGTEWTGAWSDEDPKWNQYPDVAAACGFEPGEDGTFWMAWEDVLRYFDGGGACLTKFNWFDYRVRGQFANGVPDMCFEVTVTEPVEAFLVFSQKDKRAAAGYKYEALLLSVCKSVEDGYMEVDLSSTSDADRPSSDATYCYGRDRAMKYTFVPENGPYLVVPRVYDPSNVEYVLGIISSKRAGRGIEVQFKSMSEDCRLLKNYVGFEYDSRTVQAKSAAYQFNPEVGCPMDCRGPCLSNV